MQSSNFIVLEKRGDLELKASSPPVSKTHKSILLLTSGSAMTFCGDDDSINI